LNTKQRNKITIALCYFFLISFLQANDTLFIRKVVITQLSFDNNLLSILEDGKQLSYDNYMWQSTNISNKKCKCDFLKTFPNQSVRDSIVYNNERYYAISNTLVRSCDSWSFSASFPSHISSLVLMPDNLLLVGTASDGLWTWDGTAAKQLFLQDLDLPQEVTDLYMVDNNLLVSDGEKLISYDLASYKRSLLYFSENNNIDITMDPINNLWIADGNKIILNNTYENIDKLAMYIEEQESSSNKERAFRFTSYYPAAPSQVQYQYKLDKGKNWQLAEAELLELSNLTSGRHKLYARVVVGDEFSLPIHHEFNVAHELSDTYWPIILSIIFTLLLLALLSLWREKTTNKKWQEERRKLKLENELLRSEQKVLQLEMNPHFLFNALNSIQGLIATNKNKEARKYLNQFAQLMRIMLRSSKEEKLTIKDEIKFLKNYMQLERLGKKDQFDFTFLIDDTLDQELEIPVFLIQPILENAIIHGVVPKPTQGMVTIEIEQKENQITCKIEDNGVGRNTGIQDKRADHKSYGVQIIKDRLQKYSKKYKLRYEDLRSKDGSPAGTIVRIDLPIL